MESSFRAYRKLHLSRSWDWFIPTYSTHTYTEKVGRLWDIHREEDPLALKISTFSHPGPSRRNARSRDRRTR